MPLVAAECQCLPCATRMMFIAQCAALKFMHLQYEHQTQIIYTHSHTLWCFSWAEHDFSLFIKFHEVFGIQAFSTGGKRLQDLHGLGFFAGCNVMHNYYLWFPIHLFLRQMRTRSHIQYGYTYNWLHAPQTRYSCNFIWRFSYLTSAQCEHRAMHLTKVWRQINHLRSHQCTVSMSTLFSRTLAEIACSKLSEQTTINQCQEGACHFPLWRFSNRCSNRFLGGFRDLFSFHFFVGFNWFSLLYDGKQESPSLFVYRRKLI